MSDAYEKAVAAGAVSLGLSLGHTMANTSPLVAAPNTLRIFKAAFDVALAALPPSIVVDGRVVELATIRTRLERPDQFHSWLDDLLDAAREVADA